MAEDIMTRDALLTRNKSDFGWRHWKRRYARRCVQSGWIVVCMLVMIALAVDALPLRPLTLIAERQMGAGSAFIASSFTRRRLAAGGAFEHFQKA